MIRTTLTKRPDFKSQNMFKGIEVEKTKVARPFPITELVCAVIIIICASLVAHKWGIINLIPAKTLQKPIGK